MSAPAYERLTALDSSFLLLECPHWAMCRRFRIRNEHREFRFVWLQQWLTNPPRPVMAWLEARQRKGLPRPEWVRGLRRRIKRWNTKREPRPPLSAAMRARLRSELDGEIGRLEALLGRELPAWR